VSVTFFGKHFPDANLVPGKIFWDGHFPDGGQDPQYIGGYGPAGVATLALDLQEGLSITYAWETDTIPKRSGAEQRISRNDVAREHYEGQAYMHGSVPRAMRAKLAKFAATGSPFLMGLPHEGMDLVADASGKTVFVMTTTLCDWKNPGQRVVLERNEQFVTAVIQSTTSNSITFDVDPGAVGKFGGRIMPGRAVLLEPQQDDERHPNEVEIWQLRARAVVFDFAPTLAQVALGSFLSAPFAGAVALSRKFGLVGNTLVLETNGNAAWPAAGQLIETGTLTLFRYRPGVTTLANFRDALITSSNFLLTGTYNPADVFVAFDTAVMTATGAADTGPVGNGASLTTYASHPVWDRRVENPNTITDSIHALTEILDFGGALYALPTATKPDWGRHVAMSSDQRAEFQWWKLFFATAKGRQKSFWLPTWRKDMTFVSKATNTVTVSTADGSDIASWWPDQRQHIQIEETNGTLTRAQITAILDNGNGTMTLTIGTTLATSSVKMICWLELCRFDKDDVGLGFASWVFAFEDRARVVQE